MRRGAFSFLISIIITFMSSTQVLIVGSANLDLVFRCRSLPTPGQTLLGHGFTTHPGGKGANQAVAAGKLEGKVAFVGCVGDDANGEQLCASLQSSGVALTHLAKIPNVASGTAGIFVSDDGGNVIVVAPGANGSVSATQVSLAIAELAPQIVLAQQEIPVEAVQAASAHARFILNPAPARPVSPKILARCFLVTPNESELEALTGIFPSDNEKCLSAGRILLAQGVQNVVVTLGSRGCYWISAEGGRHFSSKPVHAVDTTAAGDAFNGAVALFLAQGKTMPEALTLANCVGGLSVTRRGAQESMPTLSELRAFAPELF